MKHEYFVSKKLLGIIVREQVLSSLISFFKENLKRYKWEYRSSIPHFAFVDFEGRKKKNKKIQVSAT